jgi:hypothetical protein
MSGPDRETSAGLCFAILPDIQTTNNTRRQMNNVLVHGAWNGAWSWQMVKQKMEQFEPKVITFDLPDTEMTRLKFPR